MQPGSEDWCPFVALATLVRRTAGQRIAFDGRGDRMEVQAALAFQRRLDDIEAAATLAFHRLGCAPELSQQAGHSFVMECLRHLQS